MICCLYISETFLLFRVRKKHTCFNLFFYWSVTKTLYTLISCIFFVWCEISFTVISGGMSGKKTILFYNLIIHNCYEYLDVHECTLGLRSPWARLICILVLHFSPNFKNRREIAPRRVSHHTISLSSIVHIFSSLTCLTFIHNNNNLNSHFLYILVIFFCDEKTSHSYTYQKHITQTHLKF